MQGSLHLRARFTAIPRHSNSITQVIFGVQRFFSDPRSIAQHSAAAFQGMTFAAYRQPYLTVEKPLNMTVTLLGTWPSRILIFILCGSMALLVFALLMIDHMSFQTTRALEHGVGALRQKLRVG